MMERKRDRGRNKAKSEWEAGGINEREGGRKEGMRREGCSSFRLSGYRTFLYPCVREHNQGFAILVRNHIRCQEVEDPIDCGDGVEAQAVTFHLPTTRLKDL